MRRINWGFVFLMFLLMLPTFFWVDLKIPFKNSVSSIWDFLQIIGQITAIWGVILLSLNFVLATRLKILGKLFDGLNRVYITHHLIGGLSFVFLLVHPIFSLGQYLRFSIQFAASLLLPNYENVGIYYGLIALFIMITLLILTYYVNLKYHIWKKTHQFFGVVLIPAALHVLSISPSIHRSTFLKYYLFSILGIGIVAYVYKTLLGKLLMPKYSYTVTKVKVSHESIIEIEMEPVNRKMNYSSGQFIFVSFESLGVSKESHPFSITSHPSDKTLSLAIKSLGDYTETLKLLKTGSSAVIQGPFGTFTYDNYSNKKQIWIAGGIGITPFLSMAKHVPNDGSYSVVFIHVIKKMSDAYFYKELHQISKDNPYFTYWVYASETMGTRITARYVLDATKNLANPDIFICGPLPMMRNLRDQFKEQGIKGSQIHTEEFSLN